MPTCPTSSPGLLRKRRFIFAIILLAVSISFPAAASPTDPSDVSFRYLYLGHEDNREGQVVEHIAPLTETGRISDQPNFLFSEDQGYRVVIFYIDWCPVCQGLVPEYVDFAKRMKHYNVSVHAVSCLINKPLCLRVKLAGYPMIRMYAPRETIQGHDLSIAELHPLRVLEHFKIPVDDLAKKTLLEATAAASSLSSHRNSQAGRRPEISRWFWKHGLSTSRASYRRNMQELEADVHRSLDWTLRSSVFTSSVEDPLPDDDKSVLLSFLQLLDKTLPPTWFTLHGLLHDLMGNFLFATKSENYMVSFLDRHPPNATNWSGSCSSRKGSGYSCGLWTMFHTVTVGTVEYNIMSMKRNRLATEVVARHIRDFVGHFFNCQTCRSHFVSSFEFCEHNRCNLLSLDAQNQTTLHEWWQLPLWLARVHNDVNVRISYKEHALNQQKRQSTEEGLDMASSQLQSVLWPNSKDCRSCWMSPSDAKSKQWVESAVYSFLKQEYFTGYSTQDSRLRLTGSSTDASSRQQHGDVDICHFVLSCILVGLMFCLWDTARSSPRHLMTLRERILSRKRRFE